MVRLAAAFYAPPRATRRDFITLLGGMAAAWPLAARAQQTRRIGVMIALPESDPELKKWLAAFQQSLERLGWSEGRNVHLDYRFAPAGVRAQDLAKELLTLQPDVILAFSTPVTAAFQRESRTIPIVFIGIADAVGQGFVKTAEALGLPVPPELLVAADQVIE